MFVFRIRSCALVLGLLLVTNPLAARDDPATVQARQRWNEGVAAFANGDFELARAAFAQAYALKPTPPVLRNLGEAEIASGHFVAGANHLTRFLRQAEDLPEEEASKVKRSIAKAHPFVGHLSLTTDVSGAQVFVDNENVGTTPLQHEVYLEPGWREVRIVQGEREVQRLVEATAGRAVELHLTLNRAAMPEEAPKPESSASASTLTPPIEQDRESSWRTPVVITGGALTVTALGVGVFYTLHANSLDEDASALRGQVSGSGASSSCLEVSSDRCERLQKTLVDGRRAQQFAAGGFIAGGAFAVGTALAWWLWPTTRKAEVSQPSWQLTPLQDSVGETTWGGALSGTF